MTGRPGPIGWIGLGAMGVPMVRRLLDAGFTVRVWSRSTVPSELDAAVEVAASPADLARSAMIVCTMVGGPDDVRSIYLGPHGLIKGATPGTVLVDHTSSSPTLARIIAAAAAERGVDVLDAPVSGGPFGAASGELVIMIGGSRVAAETARPVFDAFAARTIHHGPPGSGQAMKLVNQVMVGTTMLGIAEAWAMARRADLDPGLARDTLMAGITGSRLLDWAWGRAMEQDPAPGFRVDHLIKDLELAASMGEPAVQPVLSQVLARYRSLADAGHGDAGTQIAIIEGQDGRA